jgi:hypothetical protein
VIQSEKFISNVKITKIGEPNSKGEANKGFPQRMPTSARKSSFFRRPRPGAPKSCFLQCSDTPHKTFESPIHRPRRSRRGRPRARGPAAGHWQPGRRDWQRGLSATVTSRWLRARRDHRPRARPWTRVPAVLYVTLRSRPARRRAPGQRD